MKTKNKNQLKIISYNLRYHRANSELKDLINDYGADIYVFKNVTALSYLMRLGIWYLAKLHQTIV